MVLKGFELSDDDELPDKQDPGQSVYADNKCPDIAMLAAGAGTATSTSTTKSYASIRIFNNVFVAWAEILQPRLKHWMNLIRIYHLDKLLCTANALEEALGKTMHIQHILKYCAYLTYYIYITYITNFSFFLTYCWNVVGAKIR
jgi:hypothetical protein